MTSSGELYFPYDFQKVKITSQLR